MKKSLSLAAILFAMNLFCQTSWSEKDYSNEPMMMSTDWIEEDGRTTEEACRKAITKFYKSYNNVK